LKELPLRGVTTGQFQRYGASGSHRVPLVASDHIDEPARLLSYNENIVVKLCYPVQQMSLVDRVKDVALHVLVVKHPFDQPVDGPCQHTWKALITQMVGEYEAPLLPVVQTDLTAGETVELGITQPLVEQVQVALGPHECVAATTHGLNVVAGHQVCHLVVELNGHGVLVLDLVHLELVARVNGVIALHDRYIRVTAEFVP
jgi:hypothetical protein